MVNDIYKPFEYLGPLKIYGVSRPTSFNGYEEGWFYPLYTTRNEAIQADVDRGGKGIYQTVVFYNREGEFYMPTSFTNTGMLKDPLIYTLYDGAGAENPFERIQHQLSTLIENQLPDFVQTDYEMFVKFLKVYYEFLEQNNQAQEVLQDMSKYADIDTTSQDLVSKFIQNYANDFYKSEITENRLLVKKIREIYSKKGTESAYEILFNILYKETVEFFYPYEYVLKPSSAQVVNPKFLRVKQTNYRQNIFDFENTEVIGSISKARAIVNKVREIDLNGFQVFELILDETSVNGIFVVNETISAVKTVLLDGADYSTSSLSADVYSVITKIDIIDGGLGYEKDKNITISDVSGGILAKAKIGSVNRFGSITSVDITEAGINYTANANIYPGLPTGSITGRYRVKNGVVTITFPRQHGIVRGKNIEVLYHGNVYSPIDNTSHRTSVVSIPTVKSIRFKYPGF